MGYVVGETVGFVRYHRYGAILQSGIGQITKINGHGHITVTTGNIERKFDKHGNSYKDSYGPSLIDVDVLKAKLAAINLERNINAETTAMQDIILSRRCGNGRMAMTNETLDALEAQIAKLRELVKE